MSSSGTAGNLGDPMLWDVPWNEHIWDRKTAIRTTDCHCTPSEKEQTRKIFADFSSSNAQKPRHSNRAQRMLLPAKNLIQKARSLSQPKIKSNHAARPTTGSSIPPQSKPISLIDLPPDILYPILQMVYDNEERSRDLCHCSRPRTLYKTMKSIALEHRIVNTMTLRSVCRAFYLWAHHKVFRSNINDTVEIDFSDFYRFQGKFHLKNGSDIAKRLADDFPGVAETGCVIYLGSPGQVRNIKSVVSMLRIVKPNIFSGVSFWDLDYYFRDEISELIDKIAYIAATVFHNGRHNFDAAPAIRLLEEIYLEDQLLFLELFKHLEYRPLSKLQVPLTALPEIFFQNETGRVISSLGSGCQTIVFREFFDHYQVIERTLWLHYREYYLHFYDPQHPNQRDPSLWTVFQQVCSQLTARQLNFLRWETFITAVEPLERVNAAQIEFRRLGTRTQTDFQSSWPGITNQDVERICGLFNGLKSVKITGGKTARLLVDEGGLRVGAVLKGLLPLASTLTSLIYRPGDSDLYPENWNPYIEAMDPEHTCTFVNRFSKLKTLDIETRLCLEIFRKPEHINRMEIPLHRDWNLRISKCTGHCHSEEIPDDTGSFFEAEQAHTWTTPLIQTLLQNCRDWRDRHEEVAGKELFWDVKIHMVKYVGWVVVRYDIVFMPLARPPMVHLKVSGKPHREVFNEALEEENEEWFEKWHFGEDFNRFEDDDESLDIIGWGGTD